MLENPNKIKVKASNSKGLKLLFIDDHGQVSASVIRKLKRSQNSIITTN